jgi:Phasin protein
MLRIALERQQDVCTPRSRVHDGESGYLPTTTGEGHASALLHPRDPSEVVRLHSGYVQAQMRSLTQQASEIGQIVSRAAMDAAKPKS